ncbi:hypothetical protein ACOMHN_004579 [Nucella lapillus]
MEASGNDVCMESEDAPADGTKSLMNGDVDKNDSKEESMDVEMAEDVRTAGNEKAKDCADESTSSPGKIGYLTLSDGHLVYKSTVSETHQENSVVNGCEPVDDVKEKAVDPDVPDKVKEQPDLSTTETAVDELTDEKCDSQKNSSSLDRSSTTPASCSQVDSDKKIQSSDMVNSSEPQTSETSPPEVKELSDQECPAPSSLTESSTDNLQGSNTEDEKKGDSGSTDYVDTCPSEMGNADVLQNDVLMSDGESCENGPKSAAATDGKDVLETSQSEPILSEEKSIAEPTETVLEKEGTSHPEKDVDNETGNETESTEVLPRSESEAVEQSLVDSKVTVTEQSDVSEESGGGASGTGEPDEGKAPEVKTVADEASTDATSSTNNPAEEEMSDRQIDVVKESADPASEACKPIIAQPMSANDIVTGECESQTQSNSQPLPSPTSENNHSETASKLSSSCSVVNVATDTDDKSRCSVAADTDDKSRCSVATATDDKSRCSVATDTDDKSRCSVATDTDDKSRCSNSVIPSKSTARKSVPGGSVKSKLSKVTARKTGQPQATTRVMCSSKDSKDGTIKIFNLHPNSNITLKLSELEKVLKPRAKEGSKVIPPGADSAVKKETVPAVRRETWSGDEGMSPMLDSSNSDTSPHHNSTDESADAHSSLKNQHRRRRKKGGTYDFPGGKKNPKKKKLGSSLFSSSMESMKEEGDGLQEGFRLVKKFCKKSPHKQYTVMEMFRNQPFLKQHSTHDTSHHRPSDQLAGRATVSQILQGRRKSDGTVSDGSLLQAGALRTEAGVPVFEVGPDGLLKTPPGWRVGEAVPSSHGDGAKGHMVQKLFVSSTVTKDGLVSSVKVEDASERENVPLKRNFPGSIVGQLSSKEGPASKKVKVEGEGGQSSSKQPMVMVVAQHSQNAPGLRSILPKPHMAVAMTASTSTVTTCTASPGTKVALVPVSMTGKSSFSLLPAAMVGGGGGKGRSVPVSAVTSLPKVLSFQHSVAGKTSDALRSLLATSNGPRPKTVSMVQGSIPGSTQRISIPSSMLAQARVMTSLPSSCSSSSSSSLSGPSSKCVGTEAKVASALPNGLLPVTPPKTPEEEAAAEGMAAASAPDSDVIPLCCCKIVGTFFNKLTTGATYCQALDSVDGKALGCCNKVSNLQLVRPGVKIPFMAVCEVHRKRLKMHQCCPGCGHFCTQGKFYQCRQDGSTIHNFHRLCQTERDGRLFCPHCGEESGQVEVNLTLNEPQPTQTSEQIRANLRKSLSKARMTPSSSLVKKKASSDAKPGISVRIADSSKTISSDGLPVGPDRDNLEKLLELCVLKMERPKKYRVLPKNMYHPAAEGDMDKVFYMLTDGMDPNQTCEEEDNQTVLHAAVYSGNLGLVYMLVQAGACLHTPDKSLKTPLMCAAEYGYLAIFQFLAKAGARLQDRGEDRMTCLHSAAKAGHMDIVQYVLDIDAIDINATDEGGWTPLMWATESQLVNVVKYLVSRGGDPNKKDNEENNALHWAAFAGSVEITELFLDLGCELDSPNEHGDRPLHIAARQDHYEVVVILLARGANVDLKNNKEETPVSCCINPNSQVCMALKVNKQLRSFAAKLSRPEQLVHRDLSVGREKNPIACVNSADDEPHPTDYLYVNHNVETQNLHINNVITSLQSCRCKDDCSSVFCVCSRSSVKCWFDKYGRLLEDFNMLDPPLIFECNRACRCWVNCNNRVVQNGITVRMQVFRTNGRGWGVRSLMDIPKGTFICEYIGELISDQEADRREDDSYLFDLDNKDGDTYCLDARRGYSCSVDSRDGDTYCLDARKYGNVARFINHLCEPNLVPVKVFVDHQDLRFPRICFFSSRHINAYEELGFDYGEKFWIIKWKQFTCACGSPKCKYSTETIKRTLEEYRLRHEDEDQGPEGS